MFEKIYDYSVNEIKRGYAEDEEGFVCLCCQQRFSKDEIYLLDNHFYKANKAVIVHLKHAHPDYFDLLLEHTSHGCTERQIEILKAMKQGYKDNEIARLTGVAAATIRHQRFILKEKARQAKSYLAVAESVFDPDENDPYVKIHEGARMVDERYCVTEDEEAKAMASLFLSLEPLKLKQWPAKDKKKIIALRKICECFERNHEYTEKEVNAILKNIFDDIASLRRALIEYGFMARSEDCSKYWRT